MERLTCNKLKTICNGYFVNFASKEEATKYRMLVESAPKYEEIYKKLAEYEDLEEQGLLIKTNEKNALKNAYNRGFARGIDCLYSDIDFRLQTEGSISREYLRKLVDYILND